MSKPRVCVYVPIDESGASHRRMEAAGCEVILGEASWRTGMRGDALPALSRGAHALLGPTIKQMPIDGAFLDRLPELRIIAKYSIGVEDVDLDAASVRGVLVTHSPTEANWGGVAEGTLAFMLALLKRVRERDRHVKSGGWRDPALMGAYVGRREEDRYPGLTVGIVGLGRCGSRVAELLAPWHVRLLACDPYVDEARFEHCGARRATLRELLEEADVVTLHVTLTKETRELIGREELARMKPSAVLINTARGGVVDMDALCDALESGALAGAALDVLPWEPPPPDARILQLGEAVLLCPHMVSANAPGTLQAAIPWATDAVLAALRGEVPEHVYNADAIPKWLERFGGRALI